MDPETLIASGSGIENYTGNIAKADKDKTRWINAKNRLSTYFQNLQPTLTEPY